MTVTVACAFGREVFVLSMCPCVPLLYVRRATKEGTFVGADTCSRSLLFIVHDHPTTISLRLLTAPRPSDLPAHPPNATRSNHQSITKHLRLVHPRFSSLTLSTTVPLAPFLCSRYPHVACRCLHRESPFRPFLVFDWSTLLCALIVPPLYQHTLVADLRSLFRGSTSAILIYHL
jgi:hypothetical protein